MQAGVQVDLEPTALLRLGLGPARLVLVQRTLHALLEASRRRPDPEVVRAWRRLHAERVPVGLLAREVGWSRRRLLTRFRAQIGLTPTLAARVLRFRRAADLLVPGVGPDGRPADVRIADVAAATGFADHSHLVREFRALAGCPPRVLLAEHTVPDVQDADVGTA